MIAPLLISLSIAAASPDGGTASGEELARLRQEVQQLRDRVGVLELELSKVKRQEQKLQQLLDEIQAIHSDLRSAVAERQATEREATQRAADLRSAIDSLIDLDARLARGDAEVLPVLDAAKGLLPPVAAAELATARRALENKDLAAARVALLQAIADAELSR